MKNILIITSYFYPSKNVGAIRISKFAKYLPQFGWHPIVITPFRGERYHSTLNSQIFYTRYLNLEKFFSLARRMLPKKRSSSVAEFSGLSESIFSSRRQRFIDWFLIPDEGILWAPFALRKGRWVFSKYSIDAVLTTAMDFSCHLVGLALTKQFNCPWVADFRDPWLTNPFTSYATGFHLRINAFLERKVISSADHVVTVSEPIRQDFLMRYPEQSLEKFSVIHNGYDSQDFIGLEKKKASHNGIIHIVHSGSFYPGRNPIPFLQAIKSLNETELSRLRVTFFGNNAKCLTDTVAHLGLEHIVTLRGYLPYEQNLQQLNRADVLLVIPGLGQGSLTTKLFEYLKLEKFILVLAPPTNQAIIDVLKRANTGIAVDVESPEMIKFAIRRIIRDVDTGKSPRPNWEYISQFDRINLTNQLAQILDKLVS